MNKSKISAVVLILGAGIIGSYLIFKNAGQDSFSAKNSVQNQKSEAALMNALSEKPFKFPENDFPSAAKNNLTQALGEGFFNTLNSPETLEEIRSGIVTDPDFLSGRVASDLMSKKMADLKFVASIPDSEIKISKDISVDAKKKYLGAMTEIIKKDFGEFDKDYFQVIVDVYQKLDSSSAAQLAEIYKKSATDFSALPVPVDWASLHKEIIVHYKNAAVVYSAMADYQNDPIKGYLALEAIGGVTDKAIAIQTELAEKAKNLQ